MHRNTPARTLACLLSSLLLACGSSTQTTTDPGGSGGPNTPQGSGKCTPGTEVCDGADNDCDGQVDEGFDRDGDGYASCNRDCDEDNPNVSPGGTESLNTKDDDCDGKVDEGIDGHDYDGDGTPLPADCNDEEKLVGPLALEVAGDQTDNDCDGNVDEAATPCDPPTTSLSAEDFAGAIGLCGSSKPESNYVLSAAFPTDTGVSSGVLSRLHAARRIRTSYGESYTPKEGGTFVLLSTGRAKDGTEPDGFSSTYRPELGVEIGTTMDNPWSTQVAGCADAAAGEQPANDATELRVTLKVPQNANSFSFDFNFFSSEYPEYVCRGYNDQFVAELKSEKFQGKIAFDKNNNPISIDSAFFDVCESKGSNVCSQPVSQLAGTGYDKLGTDGTGQYPGQIAMGGATGWLTTKAPVQPGETITLRFILFDEGDYSFDSAVLIDNFRWQAQAVTAPTTDPIFN